MTSCFVNQSSAIKLLLKPSARVGSFFEFLERNKIKTFLFFTLFQVLLLFQKHLSSTEGNKEQNRSHVRSLHES